MRIFSILIFCLILFVKNVLAHSSSDIDIINQTQNSLILDWQPRQFKMDTLRIDNKDVVHLSFENGEINGAPGYPALPQRILTLGIPPEGDLSVQILSSQSKSFNNVIVEPVPYPYTEKDMSNNQYLFADSIYGSSINYPRNILTVNPVIQIRDIKARRVIITPFNYNPLSKQLTVYTSFRLRITYKNVPATKKIYSEQGLLDKVYNQLFVNFEQAKSWQIIRPRSLAKTAVLPQGDYYKITVTEDGLYKIPASAISMDQSISVSAIQMFGNGGHTLNPKITSSEYNYPYVSEIAIMVEDVNQNSLFDGSDYILFYGKSVNSWFYNAAINDFSYQQHPYATENSYLINFNGVNGKRMSKVIEAENPSAAVRDYFLNRYHFEEDKYNLLASGPDWYSHRFVGRSDSWAKTFDINFDASVDNSVLFKVQVKGGSGIRYPYPSSSYKYTFAFDLNGIRLRRQITLYNGNRRQTTISVSPDDIKNGSNNISFIYSSNKSGASAYLDWFEMIFPQSLNVENNYLNLYVSDLNTDLRFPLKSMSGNDIYAFDVSDPLNPLIIKENLSAQSGVLNLDLSSNSKRRNIIIASLTSAKIKNISSLLKIDMGQDLLNSSNSADFIIITHKDFLDQAKKIADLRSNLKTIITSTESIYNYFNGGVSDPAAIRNFIRYAYYNWQGPRISYVLLFGDGHYDYRNISLPDVQRVPPFEIYSEREIDSRVTDNYYVDVNFNGSDFKILTPDLAVGRLPVESTMDADRMVEKLYNYENNPSRDGWQTVLTFVADDEKVSDPDDIQWIHQSQTENITKLSEISKFNIKKVYLSAYPEEAGGLGRIKPEANRALIDNINQGSLIVGYTGHGNPIRWAHEDVFNMNRDLERISNEGKLSLFTAATCDFGKYDDPHEPSFSEALIWKENSGAIGVLSATRLVYSGQNYEFTRKFFKNLFPFGQPSSTLGLAKFLSTGSGVNDQKYHLFADPTMHLADPRSKIEITEISPDTLKALSIVNVKGSVLTDNKANNSFEGGAVLIVNDARYDSVTTGGNLYYTLQGPLLFKGEVSVNGGELSGKFIIPKSIRYKNKNTGRLTIYAWDANSGETALGVNSKLLINGSNNAVSDPDGPEIDVYFKNQENFSSGDYIKRQPTLIAEIYDDQGINITGETGHTIMLQIDDNKPVNLSGYFIYNKNSFQKGIIDYPMNTLDEGTHSLKITAFDNLNNPGSEVVDVQVSETTDLFITDVINYPNPFRDKTKFTFQTNRDGADVTIKIYTVSGRLIQELKGFTSVSGYNEVPDDGWDGRDKDGDIIANGVYLYKIIIKDGDESEEVIEKLVLMK